MKTSNQLQADIKIELQNDINLSSCRISVSVNDGVVTLTGQVDSYIKKVKAEEYAKKYDDVKMIVNEISVIIPPGDHRSDADIAEAVVNMLRWNRSIPVHQVHVSVNKGWLRLEGHLDNWLQKEVADCLLDSVPGLTGITNLLTIQRFAKERTGKVDFKNSQNPYYNSPALLFGYAT